MSSIELQAIEQSIKQSQKTVDLGEAFERLKSNRDFKKVILEAYFEQEAIRLVHLKSDQNMQSAESQKAIAMQMDAIGTLKQFFQTLKYKADLAGKSIEADEYTRDELLAEGVL